jgi:ATP-dependent DNA ligase
MGILSGWYKNTRSNQKYLTLPRNLTAESDFDELFGDNPLAVRMDWEGYVLWNAAEHTKIRYDGKPERCNAFKWKPVHTEDVIAENPYLGRNADSMGGVEMYQYHNGEKIAVGKCGTGFSKQDRQEMWAMRDSMFPCAMEVEIAQRNASMALLHPRFVRLRPDKTEQDCTVALAPKGK